MYIYIYIYIYIHISERFREETRGRKSYMPLHPNANSFLSLLQNMLFVGACFAGVCRASNPCSSGGRAVAAARARVQGLQGYGFHLPTNRFEILRSISGLRIVVFSFLRIGAPSQYLLNSIRGIPCARTRHQLEPMDRSLP